MINPDKPHTDNVQGRTEWENLNANRLVRDAYAESAGLTSPEAKSEWWNQRMVPELKRFGLSETATVAEYVQAGAQDIERRMKDLKSGQL